MAITTIINTPTLAENLILKNDTVYLFTMNGCPYCEAMKDSWMKAKKTSNRYNIVEIERKFINYLSPTIKNTVVGYPTILKYKNNIGLVFDKNRTEEEFKKFLTKSVKKKVKKTEAK